ncbi:hypothetical protein BH10BAC5_BH10BAC5_08970 [soil metagenome]
METTTTQMPPIKKAKVIRGITCPSCSGELDIKEGIRTFNCKYCKTLLIVKSATGPLRYYVPKKLKREDAVSKAFNWMEKGISKAKNLKTSSKVDEAFLVYIPYWRVRADIVGWVFGQEKRTRSSGNSTSTYYVDVEKEIQSSFDKTYSACNVSELGVKQVNLTGDDILPVEFEKLQMEGMIFNVISSEDEVHNTAKELFYRNALSNIDLYNISFEHYDIVRDDINIVYYPLWVVRYNFNNRVYQIVVDGEDGSICYGKAPGSNMFRSVTGILGTAAGMFFLTFFSVFGSVFSAGKNNAKFFGILSIASVIIGIFILKWAYKKFRYGGEIEEGTGLEAEDPKKSVKNYAKNIIGNDSGALGNVVSSVAIGAILGSILNSRD